MTRRETDLQRAIQRWVTERGGKVIKVHGNEMNVGEPDLIGGLTFTLKRKEGTPSVIRVSVPFVAETKVGSYGLSPLQKVKLTFWSNAGFLAISPRSLDEFKDAMVERVWDKALLQITGTSYDALLSWEIVDQW